MSDEEFATEQEKQEEVLAKLKAFLDQLEELGALIPEIPAPQRK